MTKKLIDIDDELLGKATSLVDKSALARIHHLAVGQALNGLAWRGGIATCSIIDLDVGYSTGVKGTRPPPEPKTAPSPGAHLPKDIRSGTRRAGTTRFSWGAPSVSA